jgi:hypothetical protein
MCQITILGASDTARSKTKFLLSCYYPFSFLFFSSLSFLLKSNCLLEPVQEYEKRDEKVEERERMRSELDVSCGNT